MEKWRMVGEVVEVGQVQTVGRSGFAKRRFVLCEDERARYPEYMEFELLKDRTDLVTEAMKGRRLEVEAFPSCRAWTGNDGVRRFFLSMRAVAVRPAGVEAVPDAPEIPDRPAAGAEAEADEELPF